MCLGDFLLEAEKNEERFAIAPCRARRANEADPTVAWT